MEQASKDGQPTGVVVPEPLQVNEGIIINNVVYIIRYQVKKADR